MGDHHFSLQVLADVAGDRSSADARARLQALNDDVALARAMLADTGMTVGARGSGARGGVLGAAARHAFRCGRARRRSPRATSAAMAPFHNFPTGRATGNHWGDALALLITSARSPYYFSLHASDPNDPDGGSRKDTGHTFICGPTGSGKTVLIGFLVAMLSRQGATQVLFDKDRASRSWCARWAARTCRSRTACRRASIRCSCRRRRRTSSS